ncbi:type II toxin-antitoxin system Phd/YefM family antitoxin [Xenorhabdus stockiae]|uniref:prevent-host-death protein n=1 Tax=Xenorhabdus TaxID=626 RepID=UPI000C056E0B|nr:prevent-host-death protein [Xenorhabdus sp. KJ12.1]PHM66247.1 prevent-host-death protein [Xenorhabdus sp. KJ12.1]
MNITTLASRKINQDVTCAKKAAKNDPVFITDRSKPHRNIADVLVVPGMTDMEFEPQRVTIGTRPADFS